MKKFLVFAMLVFSSASYAQTHSLNKSVTIPEGVCESTVTKLIASKYLEVVWIKNADDVRNIPGASYAVQRAKIEQTKQTILLSLFRDLDCDVNRLNFYVDKF